MAKKLIEAGGSPVKHFMTAKENKLKIKLRNLLIEKHHTAYAKRLWALDINIVSSVAYPDFTAAISFDEGVIYISDGFLTGVNTFNQLDVLMRHELAHNLMLHQIRLVKVFQSKFKNDEAVEAVSCSSTLHSVLNVLTDGEISNTRYTPSDKDIVRHMILNSKVIGGLVTEDHRAGWEKLSLEQMYDLFEAEVKQINDKIKNDPDWLPLDMFGRGDILEIETYGAQHKYKADLGTGSDIVCPIDYFINSKEFKSYNPIYKKIVEQLYNNLKDTDKDTLLAYTKVIEDTSLLEPAEITDSSGNLIITLYSAEQKQLAQQVLKNLAGIVTMLPKFNIVQQTHSQEYTDAWNKIVNELDDTKYSDEELGNILNELGAD